MSLPKKKKPLTSVRGFLKMFCYELFKAKPQQHRRVALDTYTYNRLLPQKTFLEGYQFAGPPSRRGEQEEARAVRGAVLNAGLENDGTIDLSRAPRGDGRL